MVPLITLLNALVKVAVALTVMSFQLLAALLTALVRLLTALITTVNTKRHPPRSTRRGGHPKHNRSRKWRTR